MAVGVLFLFRFQNDFLVNQLKINIYTFHTWAQDNVNRTQSHTMKPPPILSKWLFRSPSMGFCVGFSFFFSFVFILIEHCVCEHTILHCGLLKKALLLNMIFSLFILPHWRRFYDLLTFSQEPTKSFFDFFLRLRCRRWLSTFQCLWSNWKWHRTKDNGGDDGNQSVMFRLQINGVAYSDVLIGSLLRNLLIWSHARVYFILNEFWVVQRFLHAHDKCSYYCDYIIAL